MRHVVIGTAGHVDHGKTALIKAMTGVDADRLKEEKERQLSIDLGFSDIILPSGTHAAIVDVPGHERFIKNMLAGVTGIDLVLMVIAADEGIMPQTREHLDIVNLLGVERGVVALTKADLVDDEWLGLVRADVAEAIKGTVFENAPIVAVSSLTGQGIEELTKAIDSATADIAAPVLSGALAWSSPAPSRAVLYMLTTSRRFFRIRVRHAFGISRSGARSLRQPMLRSVLASTSVD